MPTPSSEKSLPAMCSPRRVLLEIRRDITGQKPNGQRFGERLAKHQRDRRDRKATKEKRKWPRRKAHKPPILLKITTDHKAEIEQHLHAA
jgi:hypothetical protein